MLKLLFTCLVLIITLVFAKYGGMAAGGVYVRSSLDGLRYLIRERHGLRKRTRAADMLARLDKKRNALCKFIDQSPKYRKHSGMRRLIQAKRIRLEEVTKRYDSQAAYSVNKGDRIGICVTSKDGSDRFENENTMFFVYMHELAHIMTESYGHNQDFWDNFALLIQAAIDSKLYTYQAFHDNPRSYCGHNIAHSPYIKNKK